MGKITVSVLLICASIGFLLGSEAQADNPRREPIRMRIVATNPSDEKTNTISLKVHLPPEIMEREKIIDAGGLEVAYDNNESVYYVKRDDVVLEPREIRVFTVEVEDVWFIPEESLERLRTRGKLAMARLEGSEHYDAGKRIADTVYKRLDGIAVSQNDETIERKDYIAVYRNHMHGLARIRDDVETIEQYADLATGDPQPQVLEREEARVDMPTKTATWMVIFIILTFIGILGGVFFFVWTRHSRSLESYLPPEQGSAFSESESGERSPAEEEDNT